MFQREWGSSSSSGWQQGGGQGEKVRMRDTGRRGERESPSSSLQRVFLFSNRARSVNRKLGNANEWAREKEKETRRRRRRHWEMDGARGSGRGGWIMANRGRPANNNRRRGTPHVVSIYPHTETQLVQRITTQRRRWNRDSKTRKELEFWTGTYWQVLFWLLNKGWQRLTDNTTGIVTVGKPLNGGRNMVNFF